MMHFTHQALSPKRDVVRSGRAASKFGLLGLLLIVPLAAHAQ